jgi:hypothetical protein
VTTPIRLTIIPDDGYCAVEGIGYSGIDMTSLAAEIHALQWYGECGEEEIKDLSTGGIVHNKEITSLNNYQAVLDSYWSIRHAAEALTAEQQLADEILEV